ncbi:Cytochrome C oxidase subunit IV family protein [Sulfidibacter corallicola]|uniref:Cytochrome C oxidase subunit IV family protein n=1 Tax=Sulfidibacter corallicola TaxID=2818388 RepID=A0A8A4TI42_SULCO|nr:cytochrome C oxidase subunit IV family protein [Sulfidibacter corallicola]QTD48501.1 cytochrome C oxidase subunit IV family protein [Sulfidibacter corallicola]
MEHGSVEDVKQHLRKCIMVFVGLLVLTVVTVAVSYVDIGTSGNIVLALIIASAKASLVGAYFMHLISEKKLIYSLLVLAALFFIFLIGLPLFHDADPIEVS